MTGESIVLLDLDGLRKEQRADAWRRAVAVHFPGLTVRSLPPDPAVGLITGAPFSSAKLWSILSPPVQLEYNPAIHAPAERVSLFSVMLQVRGSTLVRQSVRSAALQAGELCVIDGETGFELSVSEGLSHVVVMQIPRWAVLSRHPHLQQCTALPFDPEGPGTILLRDVLLNVVESVPPLHAEQCAAALAAVIQLLGTLTMQPITPEHPTSRQLAWRRE